jgi:GNAT superfamily N-acetyltransferase
VAFFLSRAQAFEIRDMVHWFLVVRSPRALPAFRHRRNLAFVHAGLPSKSASSLRTAIDVFMGGVAFARSDTHPCEIHRVGRLWVMRDAPRKRAADYRREIWVVYGTSPADADQLIRRKTRGRFCICALLAADEPDEALRALYKDAGFRLGSTMAIMMHRRPRRVPDLPTPFPIERVATIEMAKRFGKATRRRLTRAAELIDGTAIRSYVAIDRAQIIGWATSITVGEYTWIQGMFVAPRYRRRGIGKAILSRLLRDDHAHGAKASFLTASHAGAMLYPHVGFETIGQLLLYTPRK